MKKLVILLLLILASSCASYSPVSQQEEDVLILTRRYVGTFLDYREVDSKRFLEPDIYWIKTDLEPLYGKIPVYSQRRMRFKPGDRLYIRMTNYWLGGIHNTAFLLESANGRIFYNLYPWSKDFDRMEIMDKMFNLGSKKQKYEY